MYTGKGAVRGRRLCKELSDSHSHLDRKVICCTDCDTQTNVCNDVLQAKELLEEAGFAKDGQAVVLGGATIAGFCAAACSLPFDFVKTRIQKMEKLPDGSYPYKSPVDCAVKTFRDEGFLKFYTGFPTYCLRSVISPLFCCHLLAQPPVCFVDDTNCLSFLSLL